MLKMQGMKKRNILSLNNGRVRLRLLEHSDLPMTLGWRNKDHIRKWFFNTEIIAQEKHEEWFQDYLEKEGDYVFIIEEIVDLRKAVGQVSIYNINWEDKRGEYGRLLIGEMDAQGRGIAKEATKLLLWYVFTELGLNRVELEVQSNNQRAIAIYRTCGFGEESDRNGVKKMVHRGKGLMFKREQTVGLLTMPDN